MKFKFALQTLLEVNGRKEEMARVEYSKAEANVAIAKKQLAKLYSDIDTARNTIAEIEKRGGAISKEVSLYANLILLTKQKIEIKKQEINGLEFELEEKRELLVLAAQETKRVEKLRDKSFETFKIKQRKKETKTLDDMMIMRYHGES